MQKFGLFLAAVVLLSSGCVAERKVMFNDDEFRPYAEKGNAIILGEAFLRTRGGDIKKGFGNPVYLVPVTTYTQEWFDRVVKWNLPMAPPDPRYSQYERVATVDMDGRFEFTDLPAGQYYVATKIEWEVPDKNGWTHTAGGWASAMVKVALGEKKKVVATQ
jgi:hypothetical protein